jgi:hypothetical protein
MLPKPTNSIDFTNTRLRTNSGAISSARMTNNAPLFFHEKRDNTETRYFVSSVFKNKGAGEINLRLLRAQQLYTGAY